MTFEGLESDTWEALPGASRLTIAQREAIESEEPLLCVVAGAGAGKTRVLTLRVARRVRDGSIEADRTLVTTFSRKAADELRTRLWSLGVSGVKAGTFHRTALGLLREHRELRGRPLPQLLPDRRRLLADVTTGDPRRTRALDGEIGWAKARLVSPEQYEAEARRHRRRSGISADQVADAYARYETERARRRLLDFDDLIVACADALAGDREFADSIRWRTRHLFVDEMQDVNPAQFRLLTTMLADEPDLFVVGDPNQSVYGFNGADPTLLDRLPEILRGTKVIRLDENHRCTPQVVAVATAVLRRRRRGRCGGAAAHDAGRRAGAHRRGARHRGRRGGLGGDAGQDVAHPGAAVVEHRGADPYQRPAGQGAGGHGRGPGAEPDRRRRPGPGVRPARETAGAARGDEDDDVGTGREDPEDRDRVVLTTFHRAKGLQWPTVIVLGLREGLMPIASAQTAAAVEEERRLLYVALTRSEEELWCSWFERSGGEALGRGPGAQPVAGAH